MERTTGQRPFTYILAVTHIVSDRSVWEQNADFLRALDGNPLRVIALRKMLRPV